MGCGVSRLNREDSLQAASGPTYLYINPLHRRIEDFAFRRRGDRASAAPGSALADGSTPSSKQLLYVDPDEVDTSSLSSDHKLDSGGGRKSLSSPRLLKSDATVAIAIAAAAAAAAPLPPTRMSEPPVQVMEAKECGEDGREEMIKEVREVGGEEAVEEVVKEVVAERERGSGGGGGGGGGGGDRKELDEEKEEEEEIGNISGREDSILLYPGSPSFREYCVFCYDESGDTDDSPKNVDGKSDAVKVENETGKGDAAKVQNDTGKASLPSSDSVEVQKKSRKRRRFRVPRRGPAGGMRSLLHVSSCSPRKSFSKTT